MEQAFKICIKKPRSMWALAPKVPAVGTQRLKAVIVFTAGIAGLESPVPPSILLSRVRGKGGLPYPLIFLAAASHTAAVSLKYE